MSKARVISGNKKPARAHSSKSIRKMRDNAQKNEVKRNSFKRRQQKYAAEMEVNKRRPTAALGGYFRYNQDAPCKTYTEEEIKQLENQDDQNKNHQD